MAKGINSQKREDIKKCANRRARRIDDNDS